MHIFHPMNSPTIRNPYLLMGWTPMFTPVPYRDPGRSAKLPNISKGHVFQDLSLTVTQDPKMIQLS
jgi:hypothetical protein